MAISVRRTEEMVALAIETLGLDRDLYVLEYPEAICASIRRAASFLCPTTPRVLVDTVMEVLNPVLDAPLERTEVMSFLEQLVSTGDLLELSQATPERTTRLLYLGPPSYVEKSVGRYLLIGIRPSGAQLVPGDIPVEYEGHTRTALLDGDDPDTSLKALGLHRISTKHWIGQPSTTSANGYVVQFQQLLDFAGASGFIEGLTIIDPGAKPTYYHGRWRPPAPGDSGDFVGRRPQAYGSDLWCVVRLVAGNPERLVDLPVGQTVSPARDDAWRLQAAIDSEHGTPQVFRARPIAGAVSSEKCIVDFFSPLPSWTERYLELAGTAVDRSRGALFSYRIPTNALAKLDSALAETMWMTRTEGERQ